MNEKKSLIKIAIYISLIFIIFHSCDVKLITICKETEY